MSNAVTDGDVNGGRFARYTGPAILFHWLIAALIAANLVIVWFVDSLPDAQQRPAINLHKSIGLTVLGLAIMRVLWRLTHPAPALPPGTKRWEKRSANAAHLLLYLLIFALPLSGWMHDSAWSKAPQNPLTLFGVIPWFRIGALMNLPPDTKERVHSQLFQLHSALAYVLYAMFVVHVAGALKHSLLDNRPSLRRMWVR